MERPLTSQRGAWGIVPALLLLAVTFVSCRMTNSTRDVAPTPTASATATTAPFWMTATARVQAVRSSTLALTNTPDPAAATPTTQPTVTPAVTTAATDPPTVADTIPPTKPLPTPRPTTGPVSGSQLLDHTLFSPALGREMPYFIYLPAGYAESDTRYPVLYMLHGYGGSNTEWIGYGLPETADRMMNAGEIPQMIIVLPQGDQAYWVNHADDGQRWGDYAAQDVVQYIDAHYRTIPDARHRAVGGLSMGGQGAMQLAMNYPNIFGAVGMDSPTLRDYASMSSFIGFFGDEEYFDAHDPFHLVQDHPDRARELKILVDVGEQDTDWNARVTSFHDLLTQLGIPHTWNTWPGQHDANYWGGHTADYLRFYATALANG